MESKNELKLICEFLGFLKTPYGWKSNIGDIGSLDNGYVFKGNWVNLFNKNWKWLMAVVVFIEALDVEKKFGVFISTNSCSIQQKDFLKTSPYGYFNCHTEETKKDAVYQSVLEFINWYKRK